jgi:predicted dehydrogenase
MGDKPPKAAWGMGGRQVPDFLDVPKTGDAYDHFSVVYEYPNGVMVSAACRQHANCYGEVTDRFFGTEGTCKIDSYNTAIYDLDGKRTWRKRKSGKSMYVLEHEALFGAIRSGKTINNGEYMANSTMMAILGRMCAYTGKKITWDEAINSQQELRPSEYSFDGVPPTMPDENGKYKIAMPGITKFV